MAAPLVQKHAPQGNLKRQTFSPNGHTIHYAIASLPSHLAVLSMLTQHLVSGTLTEDQ